MSELKATQDQLRSWVPCWEEDRLDAYLAERPQEFTALDVIDTWPDLTAEEILWVTLRPGLVPLRILQEFAIDAAEHVPQTDPRSVRALQVARACLLGSASEDEMDDAGYHAASADYSSSHAAHAASAAYYSARAAHADRAANAYYAARAADKSAHAASHAACAAACSTDHAERAAKRAAEREWQVTRLKELLASDARHV